LVEKMDGMKVELKVVTLVAWTVDLMVHKKVDLKVETLENLLVRMTVSWMVEKKADEKVSKRVGWMAEMMDGFEVAM
jgi:hypothetical protein